MAKLLAVIDTLLALVEPEVTRKLAGLTEDEILALRNANREGLSNSELLAFRKEHAALYKDLNEDAVSGLTAPGSN
jgi:hypothetical protein